MKITATDVKKLRDATGAGMMEAKGALDEARGNFDKAIKILKDRGAAIAAKKSERSASNGVISSYIHMGNRVGALIEVNVETDFVARDEKFVAFAKDLAMHVAGMNPKYVSADDVPRAELKKQGDADAYIKEVCLLAQPYVKDTSKTVEELLNEQVAKFKENIQIRRFVRFELGLSVDIKRD